MPDKGGDGSLLPGFMLTHPQLRALIVQASSSALKNEPSEEQRKHLEALHKAATARRLADKSHRSKIKAARKGRPD
jgi:hypothetical protein